MSDLAVAAQAQPVVVTPSDVDTHGRAIHLSNVRWRRLLEFVLLNQEDLDILASAGGVAAKVDEVAQSPSTTTSSTSPSCARSSTARRRSSACGDR